MRIRSKRAGGRSDGSARGVAACIEHLEPRRLFSVAMEPQLALSPAAGGAVAGYTPAQIRQAYGFNNINGGAGQTIAIVDAYRNPNIAADLHAFDQKFGLPDPKLTIVNQAGGSANNVTVNADWSTEIALDVEWAHALAPQAKILLVEANSAYLTDLMAGVDFARHTAGVSVVSMSWGGGEFSVEHHYDSFFITPPRHNGVTFIAASGDDGSSYGPIWPSTSPNVLSVGGTLLHLTSSGGYASETGWSYSTGGVSAIEREPAYQASAQNTGVRTTPDVSFNASGFAIYSSVPDQGFSGWFVVGGTSAGAPAWAALIAMANAARAGEGKGSLDGVTGTLPALYSLYKPLGSVDYSTYTSAYHDVTSGSSSSHISAQVGYDLVTGLGSPRPATIVASLASA